MIGFRMAWLNGVVAALCLTALSACRKPSDVMKSDLSEAGYQLTTADWFKATRTNDISALKKFVAAGFKPDTRDETGDSALHVAAMSGAEAAADFLLDRGLDVNLKGASDHTPLMSAVLGNQTSMIQWLLRQGADPRAKDREGFMPLMLAVRDGHADAVAELAVVHGESLDPAILLAALVGQSAVIDSLTNYGASVYARMDDGRTPLMIAAENGHTEAVKLLLDIGASRFSIDNAGRNAADLATSAGHTEIAALINREPHPGELALESPAEVAKSMDAFVDAASLTETPNTISAPYTHASPSSAVQQTLPPPSVPIEGEVLSAAVASHSSQPSRAAAPSPVASPANPPATAATPSGSSQPFRMPPLVMRHYRERELPLRVRSVEGETATVEILGSNQRELRLSPGASIPGSGLVVLRVQRRMQDSKLNLGQAAEVSVVEVRDPASGTTREWISGMTSAAHDPVALVEDAATGKRYVASPGQRFKSADGAEFIVSDVRPNQLVIEDAATGAAQTLALRGPRG